MNSSNPGSTQIKTKAERRLGPVGALWGAFLGCKLAHYPRFPDHEGHWKHLTDSEMINRVSAGLMELKPEDTNLKVAVNHGRETLNEVKGLTEYQDQKATRLLTIITFLSALSGILFARFVESYPLHASFAHVDLSGWERALLVAGYFLFACFAFLAICGALIVFHATRTQFRYPGTEAGNTERANSFLFYKSIIEVTPEAWARSFVAGASGERIAPDLQLQYLRNYIVESYLIAAKVAEKLRYLEPAQIILSASIRILLVWLIVLATTITFVPARNQTSTGPIAGKASPANVMSPAVSNSEEGTKAGLGK
jgi:hypothetical protein